MDKALLLNDNVLIKKLKTTKTASGIAIPDSANKDKQKGEIISMNQTIEWCTPKSKTKVIYREPLYEDDDYVIVKKENILAIL